MIPTSGRTGSVSADLFGPRAAICLVAGLTAGSGPVVAVRMCETHPGPAR